MKNKIEILLTGGTGSLGKALTKYLEKNHSDEIKGIRIYSRDELKQLNMRADFGSRIPIAYIIGDIRDRKNLERALKGVDICIHAAALKQVPTAEDNPIEYINTNVEGTKNVMLACIKAGVKKATLVSTDKATAPINLYGATKMVAEKVWMKGDIYSGGKGTIFNCVRYGNVIGSRGSIVDIIKDKKTIPVTDPNMTRFWIPLPKVAAFVYRIANNGHKCIYIPKMPSCKISTLFEALGIGPENWNIIGKRPGEKMDECLINQEEVDKTYYGEDCYIIGSDNHKHEAPYCRIFSHHGNPLFTDDLEDIRELLK